MNFDAVGEISAGVTPRCDRQLISGERDTPRSQTSAASSAPRSAAAFFPQ
jgi:hypothetical protein